MPTLDVFNQNAFSAIELSAAVNKMPHTPGFLGSLNIFTPRRVRTSTVMVENKAGTLSLIPASQRGAPLAEGATDKRQVRNFNTVRLAKGHTIQAHEIQNIRAFGSQSELMQVQDAITQALSEPGTGLIAELNATKENLMLGAVQGIVTDTDASTIYDYFSEYGISQPAEVDFDLDNASPASGAVRKKCTAVTRAVIRALGGLWLDGQSYVMALCGDNFWDDITAHSEVRETYLNTMQAADLRSGLAFESFRYGGITWVNYRGTDDGSTIAIGTDKAKFVPVNVPGLFQMVYSPAEFFPFANTPGQDMYSLIVRDRDRDAWVRPEIYSYPLPIVTVPAALQRAKRT